MDSLVLTGDKPSFRMLGEKSQRDGSTKLTDLCPMFWNNTNRKLCTVRAIKAYKKASKKGKRTFLLTQIGSSAPIKPDTVKHICVKAMKEAGIPENYKSHAIRMASASKMLDIGMSIDQVMTLGRWRSALVFQQFYNRRKLVNVAELHAQHKKNQKEEEIEDSPVF